MKYLIKLMLILTLLLITAAYSFAATIYVDAASGNDGNTGSLLTMPVKTISVGIAKTNAGDTINVAAGTYTESLSISKAVTIIGQGEDTILIGDSNDNVIINSVNGVTLSKFYIRAGINKTVVAINSSNSFTISYCRIDDNQIGVNALVANNSSGTIDNCKIMDFTSEASVGSATGIVIEGESTNTVTISNNILTNIHWHAVEVKDGAKNKTITISNNTIYKNGNGLTMYNGNSSVNLTLKNNIISDNGKGINILGSSITYSAAYNDVYNNTSNYSGLISAGGTGSISINPAFNNSSSYDFTLKEYSACLGTGESGVNIGAKGIVTGGTKRKTINVA
jgi:hypothetical protein